MTKKLALYGGSMVVDRPRPHVAWPPITGATEDAILKQLRIAVSVADRSGITAEPENRLATYFRVRHAVLTSSGTAAQRLRGFGHT